MSETPHLRWFEEWGRCGQCRRKADGILRGTGNESYGPHCKRCAERRLKESAAQRVKEGNRP